MKDDQNYDYALFAPLERRPEATTLTVRDLIKRVQEGRIRLPDFQRPLRWRADDVVKLFDSLWRGYPIGSLLFWKRPAQAGEVRIGSARFRAPKVPDAWWLVDGQQRTTALAACLLELDHMTDRRWNLSFNPEIPCFVRDSPPPEHQGEWVPVTALGDIKRLSRWYRDSTVNDTKWELIEEAQQRLLDYAIPVYVVETDDGQALRGVFARLNSTGARMRADEVFQALLGDDAEKRGALDLNRLQLTCDQDGFGVPVRAEILKAVLAMSGLDPSRRLENLGTGEISKLVSFDTAEDALTLAVGFLQNDCGIPHVKLIPYPVVFSLLARWFQSYPESDDLIRKRLARWVWKGAAGGAHQRAEVSRMREQVRAIDGTDQEESLQRLERWVEHPDLRKWELQTFNLKSARSRIEVLALLQLNPSDPGGLISLPALLSTDRMAREVFASRDWEGLQESDKHLAKSVANRVLLEGDTTGLVAQIRKWTPERDRKALDSHLIDDEMFLALSKSKSKRDVVEFLRLREIAVQRHVKVFLEERTGWEQPNLQALERYLEDVEGDS